MLEKDSVDMCFEIVDSGAVEIKWCLLCVVRLGLLRLGVGRWAMTCFCT